MDPLKRKFCLLKRGFHGIHNRIQKTLKAKVIKFDVANTAETELSDQLLDLLNEMLDTIGEEDPNAETVEGDISQAYETIVNIYLDVTKDVNDIIC